MDYMVYKESDTTKWLSLSLVVQWLGIHLLMQGICASSLIQEDPICQGRATKPVPHNY